MMAAVIKEPAKARLFRLVYRLSGRKPKVDYLLTSFLRYRRYLPECDPEQVIPRFQTSEIRIRQCPMGTWSTPLVDVAVVIKAAVGFQSRRILELGSYRGDTAKLLAENTPEETTICTVDIDERHGAAYRGSELEKRIWRKVGRITPGLFGKDEKFDLIFVDADHDYKSVMNDTEVALGVLARQGVVLWHDYSNQTYFHGLNGVAEALNHFAKSRVILGIRGTWLGIYSNVTGWETARPGLNRLGQAEKEVWQQTQIRG